MRFFLLAVTILFISLSANSQKGWNFFAGPQITSAHYTVRDAKQKTDMKFGFQAGVGLKLPFDINLFFAPAAFYSLKGYKVTFNQSSSIPDATATDNNTTIHTFEIAPLLQYDFNNKPSHLFIKAGPSLDFQLVGKEKFNKTDGSQVSRSMKYSFGDYGRFGANLILQLGYETNTGLLIFAQYTHGVSSINNADDGPQILHRAFGISIGKYIGRK